MRGEFIKMNKEQFKLFNSDDQFGIIEQLYIDSDFEEYDIEAEMDKLFDKYDSVCVDRNENILGEKDGKYYVIMKNAIESRMVAQDVVDS